MKFINIIIVLLILNCAVVFGAAPLPNEPSTVLINKIDSEHKNTRLYLSNELTKKQNAFIDEFTLRADYYEGSLQDIINKFILKMGLIFSGIMIFISSIHHLIRNRLEKKRYKVFLDSAKEDIKTDISKNIKDYINIPEKHITEAKNLMMDEPPKPPKLSTEPRVELPIKTSLLSKFKTTGGQ